MRAGFRAGSFRRAEGAYLEFGEQEVPLMVMTAVSSSQLFCPGGDDVALSN